MLKKSLKLALVGAGLVFVIGCTSPRVYSHPHHHGNHMHDRDGNHMHDRGYGLMRYEPMHDDGDMHDRYVPCEQMHDRHMHDRRDYRDMDNRQKTR